MVSKLFTIVLLALAVAIIALPAGASLVPMSWGFPQLRQDQSLTAFDNSVAQSTDTEAAAVAFPTTATTGGIFGTSFPTISQTAAKNDFLKHTQFMQQTENMAFSYPYLSIGGAPVPSMGLL